MACGETVRWELEMGTGPTAATPGATSVRFFGGPLDGRVQQLRSTEPVRGSVMRHVHLHDGPKIETHYELDYRTDSGWEYRLCGLPSQEQLRAE